MDRNYRPPYINSRFRYSAAALYSVSAAGREVPLFVTHGGIAQHHRGVSDAYYLDRKAGTRHCVKPATIHFRTDAAATPSAPSCVTCSLLGRKGIFDSGSILEANAMATVPESAPLSLTKSVTEFDAVV